MLTSSITEFANKALFGLSARGRTGDVRQQRVPLLSRGSIRDTMAMLTGSFLLRQLFLGGGLGVEQGGQEQRLIFVLPLAKLVVPNPVDLDF